MARSDLLINLVKAGVRGDRTMFRRTVEAISAEERAKQHGVLSNSLDRLLQEEGQSSLRLSPSSVHSFPLGAPRQSYVREQIPVRRLSDMILTGDVLCQCQDFVEEHMRIDLLRSYNLDPRNRVLLIGPPGNGKTSLAEAFAAELRLPFLSLRYENVIGTYLGETASRLRTVFDSVRSRPCVLFFDEFETLGKERGDIQETGEIKRVVSSLLLQIDDLPSHVVVVAATNHPELLDRAVYRRFQLRLRLKAPTISQQMLWLEKFSKSHQIPILFKESEVRGGLKGVSFSELEELAVSVLRRYVLTLPGADVRTIALQALKTYSANRLNMNGVIQR